LVSFGVNFPQLNMLYKTVNFSVTIWILFMRMKFIHSFKYMLIRDIPELPGLGRVVYFLPKPTEGPCRWGCSLHWRTYILLYIPEMCCTMQYVSYLDSIVNFRHFIYMLVKIVFFIVFSFCSVVSVYCIGLCFSVIQHSRFWFPYFYVHVCVYSLCVLFTSDHKKTNVYLLNVFIVYLYLIFFRIP
jgi:hypothetical protein